MKILSCRVANFACWKEFNLDLSSPTFKLISGPTGSGKSTVCDMIPWVLFGKTAKNGTVDEVLPWGVKDSAIGEAVLQKQDKTIKVIRSRGSVNDLKFLINGIETRGSNLKDTQNLLNEALGLNYDTYLLSSYINEFSPLTSFFSTTAKSRRAILESLVDVRDIISLQTNIDSELKSTKIELNTAINNLSLAVRDLSSLTSSVKILEQKSKASERERQIDKNQVLEKLTSTYNQAVRDTKGKITSIKNQLASYKLQDEAVLSAKIDELKSDTCKECGAPKNTSKVLILSKELSDVKLSRMAYDHKLNEINSLERKLTSLEEIYQKDCKELETTSIAIKNPFLSLIKAEKLKISSISSSIKNLEETRDLCKSFINDLELLLEVMLEARERKTLGAISFIEAKVNEVLSTYYASELSIKLSLEGQDAIEIEVLKDGNLCSYSQLSKGQRQLLKLSLSVAVFQHTKENMNIGTNTLFLDEALDGLSEDLKIKSYRLFTHLKLQYDNIFVVDHSSELKALFDDKIEVGLNEKS